MNIAGFELLVKIITADGIVSLHQDRKIGIVGDFLSGILRATNAFRPFQAIPVGSVYFPALAERFV
jgi:hypothetical protein